MKNQQLAGIVKTGRNLLLSGSFGLSLYLGYDTLNQIDDSKKWGLLQSCWMGTRYIYPFMIGLALRPWLVNLEKIVSPEFVRIKPRRKIGNDDLTFSEMIEFGHEDLTCLGNENKIKLYQKWTRRKPRSSLAYIELFRAYSKSGNYNEAHKNLKRGLRLFAESHGRFEKLSFLTAKDDVYLGSVFPANDNTKIFLAGAKVLTGEPNDGIKQFEEVLARNPDNLIFNLEYATFLDYACSDGYVKTKLLKLRKEQWRKCIDLVVNDQSTRFEPLGETQNEVLRVGDEFVFKKNVDRNVLQKEMDLAQKVDEILRENVEKISSLFLFDVVQPRFLSDESIDDKHVYAMRFDSGKTLMDLIEDGSDITSTFDAVVEYAAFLHATMPNTGKRLDVKAKTEDRLDKLRNELPDSARILFGENFDPLYEIIDGFEQVWNSDGHPEQWMVDDNRITRLDTEDRGLVPYPMDLVNLGEYVRNENLRSLKARMIAEYSAHFARFAGRRLNGDLELGYLSSVPLRLISLFSAWSSGNRPGMKERRKDLVLNSIDSIDGLKEKHPEIYRKDKIKYDKVKEAFKQMLVVV